MLGEYHVHSDGDEPSFALDCYWFYICGTVISQYSVSFLLGLLQLKLTYKRKSVFRAEAQGGDACSCQLPSDSTAA